MPLTTDKNFLPETGFLRLNQIIGDAKANTPPIIPVSAPTWWRGVRDGRYPKPIKIASRTTAWRVEDIRRLINELSGGVAA